MKDLTELVFILDRSGSMYDLTRDTIGGFNSMLDKQRRADGRALVTTLLFNTTTKCLHDRQPLETVSNMTELDYQPSGCTALMDAMGETIRHIAKIHKYSRPEDVPEHTIFVITTDGLENASRRYTADEVRSLVRHEEEKHGWEFIFLGANIDAVSTAANLGIREERAVNYVPDAPGTGIMYDAISDALCEVRANATMDGAWRRKIDRDYNKRK